MNLWRKLKLYKNIFITCILINAFVVGSALIIGFEYLQNRNYWKNQTQEIFKTQQITNDLRKQILSLRLYKGSSEGKKQLEMQLLKSLIEQSWISQNAEILKALSSMTLPNLDQLDQFLTTHSTMNDEQLHTFYLDNLTSSRTIVLIGLFALFVGLIVPLFLSFLTTRAIKALRHQVEHSVRQWMLEFVKLKSESTDPFKSPEFWLRVVLLTIGTSASYFKSPLALFLKEFSEMTRAEIERKGSNEKV